MISALSRLRVKEVTKNEKSNSRKEPICAKPNQKATAKSLGLVKIGDSIVHEDNAVLAGKIKVISHLVKVEEV